MRRYTLKQNVISVLIGMTIGMVMIPYVIDARANVEPIVIPKTQQVIQISTAEKTLPKVEKVNLTKKQTQEIPEVVKESISKEAYFPYTEKDVNILGNTIFHEVGILRYKCSEEETMKALRMTASCVVNRAKMNYLNLGRDIESQVFSNQYASRKKITLERQEEVDEIFYQIAEEILQNGPVISERLIFQAEFKQGEVAEKIHNQYFGLISEKEYNYYMSK